jgi:glyoxylase-like metal-dependent hydrolase (beta-lactamase superfamily II)
MNSSHHFLASLLLACVLPSAVQAAAPMAGNQAPGYYRTKVGDFEITSLSDGTHPFPVDTVMTNVSQQKVNQELADADLKLPIQGSINAFLINTGKKLILVDSGAGTLYGSCCGKLTSHLRAAGYQPEQVDEILITHFHKDHVGGISSGGIVVFPNAVVRMSKTESDYWLGPQSAAKAPEFLSTFFDAARAAIAPYISIDRFQPFDAFGELEPGIEAIPVPGHTPGHAGYLVTSRGQQLLIWGDIVHVAQIQLPDPTVTVKYDSNEYNARTTRAGVLRRASDQHVIIGAAHIGFPGLGHIRKHNGDFEWLPLNYDDTEK